MIPSRYLAQASLPLVALLASCAAQKDEYDTPPPYGGTPATAGVPANPVYETPAVYEENTAGTSSVPSPGLPVDPGLSAPTAPAVPAIPSGGVPAAPSNGAAIIHTVVAGDTLSGLSSKYNVPMASIRQANRMTNDTVVLGRKMVIPPR